MRSRFRDLVVYDRAATLADELHDLVVRWPRFEMWTVGLQLVRAVDSVAANIAEASGRWQPVDKKRLLVIARGSLLETEHWLARAAARGLLDDSVIDRLDEIARTLGGLISAQRAR